MNATQNQRYRRQYADVTELQLATEYQQRHPEASADECLAVARRFIRLDQRMNAYFNGGAQK